MPVIIDLREDIEEYLRKHNLLRKWQKATRLFENNPSHNSLNTELSEPKHRLINSFRIDKKYRALFICLPDDKIEIVAVTKHYRK
jgi:Txe/YoeB family toxin of Txe-Axe toxin-antitoxin module